MHGMSAFSDLPVDPVEAPPGNRAAGHVSRLADQSRIKQIEDLA